MNHKSEQKFSIQDSTGYWITRLARSMERDFEQRLKPLGITRGGYAVLSAIHHDNKNSPAVLAAYLGMDGAAITRYLDRIEELGLIERVPNAADRRSTHIELTGEGRRVVRKGRNSSKATNKKFTAGLSEAEYKSFQSVVQKMLVTADIMVTNL